MNNTPNSNGKHSNLLRVLTYHRVAESNETPHLNPGLISATPAMFAAQMDILARDYQVVSMENVLDAVENGAGLPDRAVLVTFDDAYRDFADHAWPILKKLNLPVTVFVPTAYPDQPERLFWWDKLHQAFSQEDRTELSTPIGTISLTSAEERGEGLKKLQGYIKALTHEESMRLVDQIHEAAVISYLIHPTVLTWDELRRLAKDGVTLGAHTQTHPILTRVSLGKARQEITCSQIDLEREIGNALPIFSYPDGSHTEAIVNVLKEEGFKVGLNGPSGVNDLCTVDPFRIRRINVTRRSTPFVFRLRMSPWFSSVETFRHRKRIREISTSKLH